jgi:hypothetical protein
MMSDQSKAAISGNLVRELDYAPAYDFHLSLREASRIVRLPSSLKYPLRDEVHAGRLAAFHPLPELTRVRFSDLAEWYEAGKTQFPVLPKDWISIRYPMLLPRTEQWWHEGQKFFAHLCVIRAIKTRLIERGSCVHCGKARAHAHHFDYKYPLLVTWLCQSHHSALHSRTYAAEQRAIKEAGRPTPTIVFLRYTAHRPARTRRAPGRSDRQTNYRPDRDLHRGGHAYHA